ncbi:unnamed protein product [Symbiodinium sp. CCMP2456]|nr:unnamed protein product [Symbiodinium sp. CCMP2456]
MMYHANPFMLALVVSTQKAPFAVRELYTSDKCANGSGVAASKDIARVCMVPQNYKVLLYSRRIVYRYYDSSDVSCSGPLNRSEVISTDDCVLDAEASEIQNESRYAKWTMSFYDAVVEQVYDSEDCSGTILETNVLELGVCDHQHRRTFACHEGVVEELHYDVGCVGDNQSWLSFPLQDCISHESANRSRRFASSSCRMSDSSQRLGLGFWAIGLTLLAYHFRGATCQA